MSEVTQADAEAWARREVERDAMLHAREARETGQPSACGSIEIGRLRALLAIIDGLRDREAM